MTGYKPIEKRMEELKIKLNPPEPKIEDKVQALGEELKAKLYSENAENKLAEDLVNHPEHYKAKNGMEAINVIMAYTEGLTGEIAFDQGNAIKYVLRWPKKNGAEDIRKAIWYLNRILEKLEEDESEVNE